MNMLAIVISLLCAGFVLFQRHFFGLPGQSREKQSKPGTSRSEPPHAKSLVPSSEILVSKSYRSGLERTGADIGTAPAGGDAIFAPVSEEKSAMQGWNTLVVQPRSAKTANLRSPKLLTPHRPVRSFRLSPPKQNSVTRRFMRCSESWTSERAPSWATPRPRSGKPSPTSTSGPLPDT